MVIAEDVWLAFGVAVVMVAIVFVGVLALESPSSRRSAASAARAPLPHFRARPSRCRNRP